jgi:hypothetical protein
MNMITTIRPIMYMMPFTVASSSWMADREVPYLGSLGPRRQTRSHCGKFHQLKYWTALSSRDHTTTAVSSAFTTLREADCSDSVRALLILYDGTRTRLSVAQHPCIEPAAQGRRRRLHRTSAADDWRCCSVYAGERRESLAWQHAAMRMKEAEIARDAEHVVTATIAVEVVERRWAFDRLGGRKFADAYERIPRAPSSDCAVF